MTAPLSRAQGGLVSVTHTSMAVEKGFLDPEKVMATLRGRNEIGSWDPSLGHADMELQSRKMPCTTQSLLLAPPGEQRDEQC